MIIRRRTWLYRLAGQTFAQSISFQQPITASEAKARLRCTVGQPLEIWGRCESDLAHARDEEAGARRPASGRR